MAGRVRIIAAALAAFLLFALFAGTSPKGGYDKSSEPYPEGDRTSSSSSKQQILTEQGSASSHQSVHFNGKTHYTINDKPPTKVKGMVFAGRKRYLEFLNCYLVRNLVTNGGWLDEIIWVVKTDIQEDLDYIQELVDNNPLYSSKTMTGYAEAYENLERDTIYVKIDDDIVFFEDHTIPSIVTKLYNHPEYSVVSGNIVNQPSLGWVHAHLETLHPWMPPNPDQLASQQIDQDITDWRVSTLPLYEDEIPEVNFTKFAEKNFPSNYHWLRLPKQKDLLHTPAKMFINNGVEYRPFSQGWKYWPLAAVSHYSFLENLENKELWRYKFETWNYYYERLSIQFIAFKGETLMDNPVVGVDEEYLTVDMPKKLERPAVIDGPGVVAHFAFGRQIGALYQTDLLARYSLFAHENICGKPWGSSWTF